MCLEIKYLIYRYKNDLALKNLQWLICLRSSPNQHKIKTILARIARRFQISIVVEAFRVVVFGISDTTRQLHGATCCLWTLRLFLSHRTSILGTLRSCPPFHSVVKYLASDVIRLRHSLNGSFHNQSLFFLLHVSPRFACV